MIVGVDYASVDGNLTPDWGGMKQACAASGSSLGVAIFRGAWGITPDSTVVRDWHSAQAAGLTTGAYLFLRMRTDQPPEDQVSVFADNVGALTESDLVPFIDIEDTGFTAAEELAWVRRAWDAMRSIYGVPPGIYDSARVWREDLHDLPAGDMVESIQWVAKPWPWAIRSPAMLSPTPFSSGRYEPVVPSPWGPKNWWLHQYQGDALPMPGISRTVDLSRFNLMVQGETGVRVKWVQKRLGIAQAGVFDDAMASALRAFQRARGLVADAIVGPKTLARLCWVRI